VQSALDEFRRVSGEHRVALGELVILGAREKARRLRAARAEKDALLSDLAARIRQREPLVDLEAAELVRRAGWTRG
jgi:hypothetical protein